MTASKPSSREGSVAGDSTDEAVQTEGPDEVNIAMKCALDDSIERFVKCFEEEEDPFHDAVNEQINERGDTIEGKSPLDMAALLGRVGMVKELATRGAEVNAATKKGYTSLHQAAAWGKIDCLKMLVDNGANLQLKTKNNERAREIAVRYNQTECVDYLDWAEAKQTLIDTVQNLRETLLDPEKVQGRLTRDDKNQSNAICTEKEQWIEATVDATTQDFITAKTEFDEASAPLWQKLSEPLPEKPEKK